MNLFATDEVIAIALHRPGLQRLVLATGDSAYVLTDILGDVVVGDHVVYNRSAVSLGLGTGGSHVVHWILGRDGGVMLDNGHIMKARYSSEQHPRMMVEELYSEPIVAIEERLRDRKVLVAGLHSQIGISALAIRYIAPNARIGYVMTDAASLPIAISDMVFSLKEAGTITHTVTAGQAFGGDYESVTVEAGVAACLEHLGCDYVLVGMGPGVVGSGTQLGQTSLECAGIVNNLVAMGASVSYALRYSAADPRDRHKGLSHHSATNLKWMSQSVLLGVPTDFPLIDIGHPTVSADVGEIMKYLTANSLTPKSMGRGVDDDVMFYEVTAAAAMALVNAV